MPATDLDQVVNLCKRRGFVFPSAEIYGGFRSTYDYGPLGALMLRNVKDAWVRAMVQQRDDIVLIDAAILSPPAIWEASGHLQNFTDPLVDCTVCNRRFREDQLDQRDCPRDFKVCEFTSARAFNLMFKTHAGPVEDEGAVAYLRPETAQGMFTNFANVLQATRKKPPFGIAQVGKSFRNEITPGNFVFRTREFEQMELEFFVPPDEGAKWYEFWCAERMRWYTDLGIPTDLLRLRAHDPDELSHYSAGTSDVEFLYPWGWGELEGIANRTDYDLTQHSKHSGQRLEYFDQSHERALRAARHRAGGRCDAGDDGVPPRRLRRGRDRRRGPHRAAPPPAARALQGRRAAALEEGHAHAAGPRGARPRPAAVDDRLRRHAVDRPSLSPSGRDRHAARGHRRLRVTRRPRGHDPRPRHHRAGARPDRRAGRRARRRRLDLVSSGCVSRPSRRRRVAHRA